MDLVSARKNMVDSQVRTSDVTNTAIHSAMLNTAREDFCAPDRAFAAYADAVVPIAAGRSLMRSRETAKLLQALKPLAGERALCLAAPYAAALLAHMGLEVEAQESDPAVAAVVQPALEAAGVRLTVQSLNEPSGGDWDVIICEAGVAEVPEAWVAALKPGGRLAAVERDGPIGKAVLIVRTGRGATSRRELFDASPEMLAGFAKRPTFQF